jgi:RNA polymerase sporulation-specific sigma factor
MMYTAANRAEREDTSDDVLLAAARAGDSAAMEHLLEKYGPLVRFRARNYFMQGGDRDDILQEGMIGLYKAVRDFRVEKLSSFRAFADLCITRQIITAIKTAARFKHVPLNQAISLDKPVFRDDSERPLVEVLVPAKGATPEEIVLGHEFARDVRERMLHDLSEFESRVLALYLEGRSYSEMARELDRHAKSIDNALQRVKRKIEKFGLLGPTSISYRKNPA